MLILFGVNFFLVMDLHFDISNKEDKKNRNLI